MGTDNVYLSSTIADLEPHREVARGVIERLENLAVQSYTAGDERPLARCVRDVKRCGAYVGILGWRYGFKPPEGSGKSITELEYEAALSAGVPCYCFLSPEADSWSGPIDPDRRDIQAFRARVTKRHVPETFTSPDDLGTRVAIALKKGEIRRAPDPGLLPYHCDRAPQELAFTNALAEAREEEFARPILYSLQAPEKQALEMYLKILPEDLPVMLGSSRDKLTVRVCGVKWPEGSTPKRFERNLASMISHALDVDIKVHPKDVQAAIEAVDSPVLLTTPLPTRTWCPRVEDLMRRFFEFWMKWEPRPRTHPVIVLLYAKYPPAPPGGLFGWLRSFGRSTAECVRAALQEIERQFEARGIEVAPAMGNVSRFHVDEWAGSKEVLAYAPGADLAPKIRELFATTFRSDEKEMEPLAAHLIELLRESYFERSRSE